MLLSVLDWWWQFYAGSASEVCVVKLALIALNQKSEEDTFHMILVLES